MALLLDNSYTSNSIYLFSSSFLLSSVCSPFFYTYVCLSTVLDFSNLFSKQTKQIFSIQIELATDSQSLCFHRSWGIIIPLHSANFAVFYTLPPLW